MFHDWQIKKPLSKKRRKHEERKFAHDGIIINHNYWQLNRNVTYAPKMKSRCFDNSETRHKLELSTFHHVSQLRKLESLSSANWKFRCVPRICFVVKVALSSSPLSSSCVDASRVHDVFLPNLTLCTVTVLSLWDRNNLPLILLWWKSWLVTTIPKHIECMNKDGARGSSFVHLAHYWDITDLWIHSVIT